MALDDSNRHDLDLATHTCDLSLDAHVEMTVTALTLFGVGIGCEIQYRALLVLAEIARRLHGHPVFDPTAAADKIEIDARNAYAHERHAQAATERHVEPSREAIETPGSGQVH